MIRSSFRQRSLVQWNVLSELNNEDREDIKTRMLLKVIMIFLLELRDKMYDLEN